MGRRVILSGLISHLGVDSVLWQRPEGSLPPGRAAPASPSGVILHPTLAASECSGPKYRTHPTLSASTLTSPTG